MTTKNMSSIQPPSPLSDAVNAFLSIPEYASRKQLDGDEQKIIQIDAIGAINESLLANNECFFSIAGDGGKQTTDLKNLVEGLIRCCYEDDDDSVGALELRISSFGCLAIILKKSCFAPSLRTDRSFISRTLGESLHLLAPVMITSLSHKGTEKQDVKGLRASVMEFTLELFRFPGKECSLTLVRDLLLLPLTQQGETSEASTRMEAAAEIFAEAVASAADSSVFEDEEGGKVDELQKRMKAETRAVATIQALTEVFEGILSYLAYYGDKIADLEVMLNALARAYKAAPSAILARINEKFEEDVRDGIVAIQKLREKLQRIDLLMQSPSPAGVTPTEDLNGTIRKGDREVAQPTSETENCAIKSYGDKEGALLPMPPFLSTVKDTIAIRSRTELHSEFQSLSESLSNSDPEAWDVRMEALLKIERIIAGGTVRLHPSPVIINGLRAMPINEQIEDLRSQITGQACRVLAALAYEMADDFCSLAEMWIPSVLKLSISGVRLMAQQGEKCILQLIAFGGVGGYPRLIPSLCEGCVGKHHQNHKKCSIIGLTVALRVWTEASGAMERHLGQIVRAVDVAAGDRDPGVREEGRRGFWALQHRFPNAAENALAKMDPTSRKRLIKCKEAVNDEWDEGGTMDLVVKGHEAKLGVAGAGATGSSNARKRPPAGGSKKGGKKQGTKRSATVPKRAPSVNAPLASKHQATAGVTQSTSNSKSSANAAAPTLEKTRVARQAGKPWKKSPRGGAAAFSHADRLAGNVKRSSPFSSDVKTSSNADDTVRGGMRRYTPSRPSGAEKSASTDESTSETGKSRSSKRAAPPLASAEPFDRMQVEDSKELSKAILPGSAANGAGISAAVHANLVVSGSSVHGRSRKCHGQNKTTLASCSAPPTPVNRAPLTLGALLSSIGGEKVSSSNESDLSSIAMSLSLFADGMHGEALVDVESFVRNLSDQQRFVSALAALIHHDDALVYMAALKACRAALTNRCAGEISNVFCRQLHLLLPAIMERQRRHVGSDSPASDIIDDFIVAAAAAAGLSTFLEQIVTVMNDVSFSSSPHDLSSCHNMSVAGALCLFELLRQALSDSPSLVTLDPDLLPKLLGSMARFLGRIMQQCLANEANKIHHCSAWSETKSAAERSFGTIIEAVGKEEFIANMLLLPDEELSTMKGLISECREDWSYPVIDSLETAKQSSSPTPGGSCGTIVEVERQLQRPESVSEMKREGPKISTKAEVSLQTEKKRNVSMEKKEKKCEETIPEEAEFKNPPRMMRTLAYFEDENFDARAKGSTCKKTKTHKSSDEATLRTPLRKVNRDSESITGQQFYTPGLPKTPLTDAVLRYMTRPSPLSAVKLSKDRMDDMPYLIEKLTPDSGHGPDSQELYFAMQALLQLARDKCQPEVWERYFDDVLRCILDGMERSQQTHEMQSGPASLLSRFNSASPNGQSCSPMATTVCVAQQDREQSESRHLYLQGLRVLLKYQPGRFKHCFEQLARPLLLCARDSNNFVAHAAEMALEQVVTGQDPERCLNMLMSHLKASVGSKNEEEDMSRVVLILLRIVVKLIERVPYDALEKDLSSLMSCVMLYTRNKSVDLRKASIFTIVELHCALGGLFSPYMDRLDMTQRRLVLCYVDRRKENRR